MYTGTFHVFSEDIFAIALFYFRFSFSLKSRFESKKEESEDQKVSEKNVFHAHQVQLIKQPSRPFPCNQQ
jgi:hypothetical protein